MKLVNRNWIVAKKTQDTNEHKICKKGDFFQETF
jgi:hypothetical protein